MHAACLLYMHAACLLYMHAACLLALHACCLLALHACCLLALPYRNWAAKGVPGEEIFSKATAHTLICRSLGWQWHVSDTCSYSSCCNIFLIAVNVFSYRPLLYLMLAHFLHKAAPSSTEQLDDPPTPLKNTPPKPRTKSMDTRCIVEEPLFPDIWQLSNILLYNSYRIFSFI